MILKKHQISALKNCVKDLSDYYETFGAEKEKQNLSVLKNVVFILEQPPESPINIANFIKMKSLNKSKK
jgi:hypothetical protein